MEITGKLIQKLPVQSGVSSSGNSWSKAEFVIETVEQYPKKVCSNLWGERAKALDQFQLGDLMTVSFDLESREYNGRWYTDVKAWKVEPATPGVVAGAPAPGYGQPQYAPQGYPQPQQPVYQQQPGYGQPLQPVYQQQPGYGMPQQPAYPPQPQYAPAAPAQPQTYAPATPQPSNPVVQPQPDTSNLPPMPPETFTDNGDTDDLPF